MVINIIDKKDFSTIKKKIDSCSNKRSKLINESRDIVQFTKRIIYSLHRNELGLAKRNIKKLKKDFNVFQSKVRKDPRLQFTGFSKVAVQEYVEATAFYYFIAEKRIPTHKELKVDEEYYLMGLFDLSGELVRKAVNDAIKENYDSVYEIRTVMGDLYSEFLKFDFSNGELRKKFDAVKYSLHKVEDLALKIKMTK